MCEYSIVVRIITKIRCKCYTSGQRTNTYMLIIYIIHGSPGDIMLSHDLRLNVGCNFTYATNTILIVNVDYNCFIVAH